MRPGQIRPGNRAEGRVGKELRVGAWLQRALEGVQPAPQRGGRLPWSRMPGAKGDRGRSAAQLSAQTSEYDQFGQN